MNKIIKVLNLYACLGGNRYKWENCKVTAVELDPVLAKLYQERFLNDTVIVADAHQYLLDHYKEYDFIWSSPPCPTHSKVRHSQKNRDSYKSEYPNMMLYQEIIFLKHHFKGKYCVENVKPYYEPLITAKKRGRHLYWTNFNLPNTLTNRIQNGIIGSNSKNELKDLCVFHNITISNYKGEQSLMKIARNLVDYEAGKTIFETAYQIMNYKKPMQVGLFS